MRHGLALFALLFLPAAALAQPERYELGRRLKRFEQEWEKQPDPARRKKALALVEKVTPQFFSFQLGEAGRTLDAARYALLPEPPADAVKWLDALYAVPEARLVDAGKKTLSVTVKAFYPPAGKMPEYAQAALALGPGKSVKVPLGKLPAKVEVPFPDGGWAGDWYLKLTTEAGATLVEEQAVRVSVLHDLTTQAVKRLELFKEKSVFADERVVGIELATIRSRAELLAEMADGTVPETDMPIVRLTDGEGLLPLYTLFGKQYFTADRPGDFWLSIPTGKKKSTPVRLLVPTGLAKDKPVPLVFALHGAGGTENLFFEGYGAGHIVKECAKRGWLLVAPRSDLGFGSGPPVAAILEQLAARYPIDKKRVFVVGHSMGAAQTVALCQAHPTLFAAAAALGGGGRVTDPKAFAGKPVFVGVGTKDFALAGARSLAKALTAAGAKAELKEYPDVEHMVIVREALPDVFAVFDGVK